MQKLVLMLEGIVILILIGLLIWARHKKTFKKWWEARRKKPKRTWNLRPRTPEDCLDCRLDAKVEVEEVSRTPRQWEEVKSKRGRPKTVDTEGFACMVPMCEYYKITDASIHALRGNGKRGKCEPIQQLKCGACGGTHTARLNTPMYRLKKSSDEVGLALHLSAKGMSVADISEVLEFAPSTIQRWLARMGQHSQKLHRQKFRNLIVRHLQLDELVARVRNFVKQRWVWTGTDAETKVIVGLHVGGRKQADAHRLIHDIASHLAPGCIPVFSSDGLRQYFYALTAHFGEWITVEGKRKPVWIVAPGLLYGQLRKVRARYRLKQTITKVLCGTRDAYEAALKKIGLSGLIQTAYVERLNLTLRHLAAPLRRRTWAIARSTKQLRWQVEWARAYYHFCRPHHSLRVEMDDGRYRGRTPAMAAGVTNHKWTVKEVLLLPIYAA